MLWREPYETSEVSADQVELPVGLPDECAYIVGPLEKWAEMTLWERLVADKGAPVWFGVRADAAMARAVIPGSRLARVLLVENTGDEVVAVVVHGGVPSFALRGKATESALDQFLEAM